MSHLFTPLSLGALTLPNRIVIAPMCQYSATDGDAGDWHLMHLGMLSQSGAGLLILEATAVTEDGRITHGCLGLYRDGNATALQRVLQAVRRHSAMPVAVQLSHAGRKASSQVPWQGGRLLAPDQGGWQPLAPSAVPHADGEAAPAALSGADLTRIRQGFVDAARRAARIGIQAIELHAAHGYLLHQFLSPLSNHRTDGYGGGLQARMRFALEVFDAVRQAVPPELPVGVRVSATDWVDGGWDVAQTVALGQALKARGCAFMHVSSGGVSQRQQVPVGPGYQVPLAAAVRQGTGLPTLAVGLITEPQQAEAVLAEGHADAVALGRSLLYNPRWPWHAAAQLGAQVQAAPAYWRSAPQGLAPLFAGAKVGMR